MDGYYYNHKGSSCDSLTMVKKDNDDGDYESEIMNFIIQVYNIFI